VLLPCRRGAGRASIPPVEHLCLHPAGGATLQHARADQILRLPEDRRDVASDWKIAPDGLTYTFRIRPGNRSTMARRDGRDVKATYDKIVFPPAGR